MSGPVLKSQLNDVLNDRGSPLVRQFARLSEVRVFSVSFVSRNIAQPGQERSREGGAWIRNKRRVEKTKSDKQYRRSREGRA